LTNPAAPPYQLIGAWSREAAKLMADTLAGMPLERAFVVHGAPGWDEASPAGEFVLYDVRPGSVQESVRTPEDYGVARCLPEALAGGDAAHNAAELQRVFNGEDRGAHRDALLMGTSLVLEVLGAAANPKDGVAAANAALDDGRASALLKKMQAHFRAACATSLHKWRSRVPSVPRPRAAFLRGISIARLRRLFCAASTSSRNSRISHRQKVRSPACRAAARNVPGSMSTAARRPFPC
jgi:hypothetical protein